jgi:AcrR family transcriptional regulator
MNDTKSRILDAAEKLFARNGFEGTSLRQITADAEVNLAAVNYHFQSKETLMQAIFERRLGPINARRLEMLDALESRGTAIEAEEILDAFLRPVLEGMVHTKGFGVLYGRLFTEGEEFMRRYFLVHFQEVATRFRRAWQILYPELPERELLWRMHFAIGVMAHTLAGGSILRFMSGGRCDPADPKEAVPRVIAFIAAGMRAPIPPEGQNLCR